MNTALELYVKATTGLQHLIRSQRGQGTVEYVGIVFIVAAIAVAILTFFKDADGDSIGQKILEAIGTAISNVVSGTR
jgi:hypothetical protein